MGKQGIEALGVLGSGAKAGPIHSADHDGRFGLAAEHVTELRRLVENLVKTHAHEVDEHELAHRAQACGSGTNCGTDKARFADRGVHDAIAVFAVQAFSYAQYAAPGIHFAVAAGATDDVFAHQHDVFVARHFLIKRFVNGLLVSDFSSHGPSPQYLM